MDTELANNPAVASRSGAFSTPATRYDLLPPILLEQVAKRFEAGAVKYGPENWRKGLADTEYLRDRANHALQHLLNYIHGIDNGGDGPTENLAAVGWAVAVLLEAERQKSEPAGK